MVNLELKPVYHFGACSNHAQYIFDDLLHSALLHKMNGKGAIRLSSKDLTEAIFNLTDHDKCLVNGMNRTELNGQKIKELFISCIYLKYLDSIHPKQHLLVSVPFNEESYDVILFFVEEGGYSISDRKCRITGKYDVYEIQVKENFDFEGSQSFSLDNPPKAFDIESIKKNTKGYTDELVLVFSRNYALFKSDAVNDFLNNNKNTGIITMPSLASDLKVEKDDGTEEIVKFEKEKFHFFINTSDNTAIHVKFDEHRFLIKDENLTPGLTSVLESISR